MNAPLRSSAATLEYVSAYVNTGLAIVPLHSIVNERCTCRDLACKTPGAHPKHQTQGPLRHWPQLATQLSRSPCPNVGIAIGPASGIFGLVVSGAAGHESLDALESKYGALPATMTAANGRDETRLFKLPAGSTLLANLGATLPGLAIKGEGVLVVEPSAGPLASSWRDWELGEQIGIATAPAWLLALASGKVAPELIEPAQDAPAEQPEGPACAPGITNEEFLRAVIGDLENGESAWICGFPDTQRPNWTGKAVQLSEPHNLDFAACNMYFSCGVLRGPARQKKYMSRMAVVVVDDPDLNALTAPPSYVLETSPGNHQVGYIISTGGDHLAKCDRLMEEVAKRGWCDKSGNNPVRYGRLPVGVNTKPRESGPFSHRLLQWHPDRRYSLDDAARALGIELSMPAPLSAAADAPPAVSDGSTLSERLAGWRADIQDPNLDQRSYHSALASWAASRLQTGMAPGAVVEDLRAEMLACKPTAEQCATQGRALADELRRWQQRHDDIPRAVSTAHEKFGSRATPNKPTWTMPVDLWSKIVAPAAKPEFFPRVVSDYSFEVAEVSGFDPGFMAMAAMVALSGSIDDGIKIQCKRNDPTFLQDARLWLALVGPPSAKKSPVLKKVFARLYAIEERLREQYSKAMKKYAMDHAQWKAECKKAKYSFGAEKPQEPCPPPLIRLVVSDTTPERLQTVLAANPRGVIQIRDELSGWFGAMGAYTEGGGATKDQALWLQLYDGGPLLVDRVGRDDLFVKNWGASVIGGIQPDAMKSVVSKLPNDGLLQRFIPVIGGRRPATDRHMNMQLVDAFDDLAESLHAMSPSNGPLMMTTRVVMSEEAEIVRRRVFATLGALMTTFESSNARLASHIGKWEGLYCRLALVVHCIECADGGVHPSRAEVSLSTALMVERLMFKYMLPHLMCFYEYVLDDGRGSARNSGDLLDDVRKLGEHILTKNWQVITDRDITLAVSRWRHRNKKEKAERYAALESMGWITPGAEPDRLGIAPRYLVNPAVHSIFVNHTKQFAENMKVVADLLSATA